MVFNSMEHMLGIFNGLFESLYNDPDTGSKLKKANMIVKWHIHDPTGILWLNSGEARLGIGDTDFKADVELNISGDDVHLFMLRKLNLTKEIASGRIKVKGPVMKLLKFLPLIRSAQDQYPEVSKGFGLPVEGDNVHVTN